MLIKKPNNFRESTASKMMGRTFDWGLANPVGDLFDRNFLQTERETDIRVANNAVGQSMIELSYPNGFQPDGVSSFSPAYGTNVGGEVDSRHIFDRIAEGQVSVFWKRNKERYMKYHRVAGRAECSEALDQIANEAIYPNDSNEINYLEVVPDAPVGESVKIKLQKIYRQEIMNRITDFDNSGWKLMRRLLIEGRLFLEIVLDPDSNKIDRLRLLPGQNMMIIVQDGIIIGYRQMLEGQYDRRKSADGKPYIDFSANQILYIDLEMWGPGGINDPRSPVEEAVKPFNTLNSIEDSVLMYRIQWGSEKLVFKIDTGSMPAPKAMAHLKNQAKLLSRQVGYNSSTGEVTNAGRVIGLSEHFFLPTSQAQSGSSIDRIKSGENVNSVEDLKYFKRNLVNSMKVPPGRITALAGDGENFGNGKIGEVTQAEVAFSRMVFRYQAPMGMAMRRLFVMVLNTHPELDDSIKKEEYYKVRWTKANNFQNYMDSEIRNNNIAIFKSYWEFVHTKENPDGPLSVKYATAKGLKWSQSDESLNAMWIKEEKEAMKLGLSGGGAGAPTSSPSGGLDLGSLGIPG